MKDVTNMKKNGKIEKVSEKTIGRLSLYRRAMDKLAKEGRDFAFSHEIAHMSGATPDQVRRDIMVLGYSGSPNRGYSVAELSKSIGEFLDDLDVQKVVLVGVGNLGRAILSYFTGKRPKLSIIACFDNDTEKTGRVINGCRCYPMSQLQDVINENSASIAIMAVPFSASQEVADRLTHSGIKGILNFTPVSIKVPHGIHVEDIDMTMALEKVAFYSRQKPQGQLLERRTNDKAGH